MNRYLPLCLLASTLAACATTGDTPPERRAPREVAATEVVRCERRLCELDLTFAEPVPEKVLVSRCPRTLAECGGNEGRLTARGRAAARAVRDNLSGARLKELYGCPGCADGPMYRVAIPHAGEPPTRHIYDPVIEANIPEVLRDAHRLLHETSRAVLTCTPSAEVEIVGECVPPR